MAGLPAIYRALWNSIWMMPSIILGGIYLDTFTPSETVAVGVAYALAVAMLGLSQCYLPRPYRSHPWKSL